MSAPSFNAITDAILRLVQALDDNDHDLFVSALTEDATADLTGFNSVRPAPPSSLGVLTGRDVLVARLLGHVGPDMTTMHKVSNLRITRAWTEGQDELREVTAYALASHFRSDDEAHHAERRGLHMGNRYRAEVVRMRGEVDQATGEDRWRVRLFVPWNVWQEGDYTVRERK